MPADADTEPGGRVALLAPNVTDFIALIEWARTELGRHKYPRRVEILKQIYLQSRFLILDVLWEFAEYRGMSPDPLFHRHRCILGRAHQAQPKLTI